METIIEDITNCIIQFEYPLANSMNDAELGDIFKASNRCFLISWMLKLLGIYDETVNTESVETLAQILYENGFCTKNEMVPFMICSMDHLEQLTIIQNICIYIKIIKISDSNEIVQSTAPNEDLDSFLNNNLNLFPMYGEIKVLNNENEKKDKSANGTENQEHKETDLKSHNVDIATLIEDISSGLPNLKHAADNGEKNSMKDNRLGFLPESAELFTKCNKYLNNITQFIKDVNTINEFTSNSNIWVLEDEWKNCNANKELLQEISSEIYSIMRYQRSP